MKIQLNINRIKQQDKIKEIFTFTENSFTKDTQRQIYQYLQFLMSKYSLANKLPLQEIQELNNGKIFIYPQEDVQINEFYKQITIDYFPSSGVHKCSNCYHKLNNYKSIVCNLKGKLKFNQPKCQSWKEKSLDNMIRGTNVHKQGRSKCISSTNTKILEFNK